MSPEIVDLIIRVQDLLAMLEQIRKQGDRKAKLVADDVRFQLAQLRDSVANADNDRLTSVLLDLVPDGKSLDAIDFQSKRYPEFESLRTSIQLEAAKIAKPLIDAL